jgi:hypothetical protein
VSGIAILMRRRLMTVWLWVGLFVAAVIWDFVDHQLTVRARKKHSKNTHWPPER